MEEIRYGAGRKLDKSAMVQLGSYQWIRVQQNLIVTGVTGCGKTWLACALGNAAFRQGLYVVYVRAPRLFEELHIMYADGSFGKRLSALAKTDLDLDPNPNPVRGKSKSTTTFRAKRDRLHYIPT
jgi:DNA replication protein DnaC